MAEARSWENDWEMVGWAPRNKEVQFGEFEGIVDKIVANGSSSVKSVGIEDIYGQACFIHSSVIEQCGLYEGAEIRFNVHISKSTGQPQVSAPCWIRRGTGKANGSGKGSSKSGALPKAFAGQSQGKGAPNGKNGYGKDRPSSGKNGGGYSESYSRSDVPGEVLIGTVKHIDAVRGFCMLDCPDTGIDRDTFVHSKYCPPEALEMGDYVAFSLHWNAQNMPQAGKPIYKMVGHLTPGKPVYFPEHAGLLKRQLENGSGFLECPEVRDQYGKDAYVHTAVVEQCGLREGDEIAFDVHVSGSGNPQVSAPCWVRLDERQSGKGGGDHGKGGHKGTPATTESGKAVMVSRGGTMRLDDKSDAWQKGSSGGKGKTSSTSSSAAKGSWSGSGKSRSSSSGKGGTGDRDLWGHQASKNVVDDVLEASVPEDFYAGRVKLVDLDKGVSLVSCPRSGHDKDVYTHASVANPYALEVNDAVCFKLHWSARGMPQASAPFWKRVGESSPGDPIDFGQYEGLIASLLPDGSAEIESSQVQQLHEGRKAVISQAVLEKCGLEEGNLIAFSTQVGEDGKTPEAIAPCWICCSSEKWVREHIEGILGQQAEQEEPVDEAMQEMSEEFEGRTLRKPAQPKWPPQKRPRPNLEEEAAVDDGYQMPEEDQIGDAPYDPEAEAPEPDAKRARPTLVSMPKAFAKAAPSPEPPTQHAVAPGRAVAKATPKGLPKAFARGVSTGAGTVRLNEEKRPPNVPKAFLPKSGSSEPPRI